MSAADHLHPEQLRMFMPATEIYSTFDMGDRMAEESKTAVVSRKLVDAKKEKSIWTGKSLYEDVRDSGVREPVEVFHTNARPSFLWDGHHRLASALSSDPDRLVPVIHNDDNNRRRFVGGA